MLGPGSPILMEGSAPTGRLPWWPVTRFNFDAPILVLAPHLLVPPRNGADLLVERSARHLSQVAPEVTAVGASETLHYRSGELAGVESRGTKMRGRSLAAARTLAKRSHYFKEKFLTPGFRTAVADELDTKRWGGVICSYLVTAEVMGDCDLPTAAWTHNDEFLWFADLEMSTSSRLGREVAQTSFEYLARNAADTASSTTLLHVTETDQEGFSRALGEHNSLVVPIGTDLDVPVAAAMEPGAPPTLLFVGSLSVTMNADALEHFAERFMPAIAGAFPTTRMVVAGSNPSQRVVDLCSSHGWSLRPDLPDAELDALYEAATFTLMPFAYATGAKLKLLGSVAHGVPFLATGVLEFDEGLLVEPSVASDDPDLWVEAVTGVVEHGISQEQRRAIADAARPYSWQKSVELLVAGLSEG